MLDNNKMKLTIREDDKLEIKRQKWREAGRRYILKHPDRVKARRDKVQKEHPEKTRGYQRKYYNSHKKEVKERTLKKIESLGGWSVWYRLYCREKQCNGRLKGKHLIPLVGDKNPNWKGGITDINNSIRTSVEYKLWRNAVFSRDYWTCQCCAQVGGKLVAHHIKQFKDYPELRTSIENGVTLCKDCHLKIHKLEGK